MRVNIEVLHITSSGFAGDQIGWLYSIMLAALPMHVTCMWAPQGFFVWLVLLDHSTVTSTALKLRNFDGMPPW